mgnify:FL=1|jgi:nucleoside-diphosphate-sugar epimerase|tara:strand:+ start:2265 stop:3215 length:951 start_codon:yes stop_codon:yes gene_type:complete
MGGASERRILVTGALGQIGMELLSALSLKHGSDAIIATDIRDNNNLEKMGIKFQKLDILDLEGLEDIIKNFEINEVYHLAAILSATGEKNPRLCWDINVNGLLNVLELSRKYKYRIFSPSSIAVFGSDVGKLALQNSSLNPSTIYGVTKVTGELMAEYYYSSHNVDIRGLRYPGLISWEVMPGGGTTDYAVEIFHAATSSKKYTCFVDEETRLPMMYMKDAIRATLELMDAPSEKLTIRGGYNLPSLSFSAKELYEKIKEEIPDFECDYVPDHRQEYANSWPDDVDGSMSEKEWGFRLEYDLELMCNEMIKSLKNN